MMCYDKYLIESTPAFVFDLDILNARIKTVSQKLPGIPLCYSIKANPFLTSYLPREIARLEVCSPGELKICETLHVDMDRIIFSGVNKTPEDVRNAVENNVGIFTAESLLHVRYIHESAMRAGKKVKLILRLSSGNQFGMDSRDVKAILSEADAFPYVDVCGIHYYAGTQKKKAVFIEKELESIDGLLCELKESCGFVPAIVEYGPGIAADYFGEYPEKTDLALLDEVAVLLNNFAKKYPLSVEFGRFFAADCGTYFTKIVDTKTVNGIHYAICDGGIHHLRYYGQTMAMQIPKMDVINPVHFDEDYWSLCGSLCTVADVLVRKVRLKGIDRGSVLAFRRCGAYSVTEGSVLFLSRAMPKIFVYSELSGLMKIRDIVESYTMNCTELL